MVTLRTTQREYNSCVKKLCPLCKNLLKVTIRININLTLWLYILFWNKHLKTISSQGITTVFELTVQRARYSRIKILMVNFVRSAQYTASNTLTSLTTVKCPSPFFLHFVSVVQFSDFPPVLFWLLIPTYRFFAAINVHKPLAPFLNLSWLLTVGTYALGRPLRYHQPANLFLLLFLNSSS